MHAIAQSDILLHVSKSKFTNFKSNQKIQVNCVGEEREQAARNQPASMGVLPARSRLLDLVNTIGALD
jgi:hypothetical protein